MCNLNFYKKIILIPLFTFFSALMAKELIKQDNYLLEYKHPTSCKDNEYFNINSFSCIKCDEKKNLKLAKNGKL